MTVAAIIPVFRRREVVIEALESVLAQTRPPDRLVVVDDASPDGTAEVVERWIARRAPAFPAELVRRAVRGGPGAARNTGAERARDCEALAFLDSDDLWYPRYLESVATALLDHSEAVAAASDRRCLDASTGVDRVQRMDRFRPRTTRQLLRYGPTGTSNTVLRTKDFRAVGGFDPGLRCGEDTLLMLRLSLRGRWLHVPGVHTAYRFRIADRAGEAASLSGLVDHNAYLTPHLERFFDREGGREAVPDAVWRKLLSRRWCASACGHRSAGDHRTAREHFGEAVRLWWWNPLARLSLWRLAGSGALDSQRRSDAPRA